MRDKDRKRRNVELNNEGSEGGGKGEGLKEWMTGGRVWMRG